MSKITAKQAVRELERRLEWVTTKVKPCRAANDEAAALEYALVLVREKARINALLHEPTERTIMTKQGIAAKRPDQWPNATP